MKFFNITFLILLLSISSFAQSNSILSNNDEETVSKNVKNTRLAIMNSLNKNEQNFVHEDNSEIFLTQIGNSNYSYVKVNLQNSNLNLTQKGNNNLINIDVRTKEIIGTVFQEGNFNKASDVNYTNTTVLNELNLVQQGNNLTFERNGANSISNKLKIKMTGKNKSVIIHNFK